MKKNILYYLIIFALVFGPGCLINTPVNAEQEFARCEGTTISCSNGVDPICGEKATNKGFDTPTCKEDWKKARCCKDTGDGLKCKQNDGTIFYAKCDNSPDEAESADQSEPTGTTGEQVANPEPAVEPQSQPQGTLQNSGSGDNTQAPSQQVSNQAPSATTSPPSSPPPPPPSAPVQPQYDYKGDLITGTSPTNTATLPSPAPTPQAIPTTGTTSTDELSCPQGTHLRGSECIEDTGGPSLPSVPNLQPAPTPHTTSTNTQPAPQHETACGDSAPACDGNCPENYYCRGFTHNGPSNRYCECVPRPPICNNGMIEPPEQCDPPGDEPACGPNTGSGVCREDCTCEETPIPTPTINRDPTLDRTPTQDMIYNRWSDYIRACLDNGPNQPPSCESGYTLTSTINENGESVCACIPKEQTHTRTSTTTTEPPPQPQPTETPPNTEQPPPSNESVCCKFSDTLYIRAPKAYCQQSHKIALDSLCSTAGTQPPPQPTTAESPETTTTGTDANNFVSGGAILGGIGGISGGTGGIISGIGSIAGAKKCASITNEELFHACCKNPDGTIKNPPPPACCTNNPALPGCPPVIAPTPTPTPQPNSAPPRDSDSTQFLPPTTTIQVAPPRDSDSTQSEPTTEQHTPFTPPQTNTNRTTRNPYRCRPNDSSPCTSPNGSTGVCSLVCQGEPEESTTYCIADSPNHSFDSDCRTICVSEGYRDGRVGDSNSCTGNTRCLYRGTAGGEDARLSYACCCEIPQNLPPRCGNGIIEGSEQCDPPGDEPACGPNTGSGVCREDCTCEETPIRRLCRLDSDCNRQGPSPEVCRDGICTRSQNGLYNALDGFIRGCLDNGPNQPPSCESGYTLTSTTNENGESVCACIPKEQTQTGTSTTTTEPPSVSLSSECNPACTGDQICENSSCVTPTVAPLPPEVTSSLAADDMTPEQRRIRLVELRRILGTLQLRLEQIEGNLRELRAVNPQTAEIRRLIGIYEGLKTQLVGQIARVQEEIATLEATPPADDTTNTTTTNTSLTTELTSVKKHPGQPPPFPLPAPPPPPPPLPIPEIPESAPFPQGPVAGLPRNGAEGELPSTQPTSTNTFHPTEAQSPTIPSQESVPPTTGTDLNGVDSTPTQTTTGKDNSNTTTVSSPTSVVPALCGDTAPACDGDCPDPAQHCIYHISGDDPNNVSCVCETIPPPPPTQPPTPAERPLCSQSSAPACDGTCPENQRCVAIPAPMPNDSVDNAPECRCEDTTPQSPTNPSSTSTNTFHPTEAQSPTIPSQESVPPTTGTDLNGVDSTPTQTTITEQATVDTVNNENNVAAVINCTGGRPFSCATGSFCGSISCPTGAACQTAAGISGRCRNVHSEPDCCPSQTVTDTESQPTLE